MGLLVSIILGKESFKRSGEAGRLIHVHLYINLTISDLQLRPQIRLTTVKSTAQRKKIYEMV